MAPSSHHRRPGRRPDFDRRAALLVASQEADLSRRLDAAKTEFLADAQLFSFRAFQSEARRNQSWSTCAQSSIGSRYASGEPMSQQPSPTATKFSDDGFWWWDGAAWKPAVSPDRLWRWNGQAWVPASQQQGGAGVAASGGSVGAAIGITIGVFVLVLVLVSILVTVILLTMGGQISNVFSNVVAALSG